MNISTERIWCYMCEKEVHIRAAVAHGRTSPDSTSASGSSSGARLGSPTLAVAPDDELEPDDADSDEEARPRGLVGMQNMGNTCYMNAALQALSNTAPLTSYFLECAPAVSILAADKKPGLSRAYQKLVKEMWSRTTRGYVIPNGILYGMRNVHPMFRGYHQHDTQEFLRCFMDQLHEELKEPVCEGAPQDKPFSEARGDHGEARSVRGRRRAVSSGASDAPLFARMRRKSPAPSSYSETRADGYLRVQGQGEGVAGGAGGVTRHRRSASFAGTQLAQCAAGARGGRTVAARAPSAADSDSELSGSSEAEERYETCSSGASDAPDTGPSSKATGGGVAGSSPRGEGGGAGAGAGAGDGGGGARFRSIVSDVFDGRLLSSVQCLICDRVSTRVETFQDLSLPIPSREHLAVLRCQQPVLSHHAHAHAAQDSWVWWVLSWLRSWFYGPVVSLQDCLAAFFSADELKGDNMYSCSRCNKLRNGIKMSGVVRLPEVLCVHLKRFRHELMFSAKVAARVSFPVNDLNMAPYTHKDCTSKITRYELCAVISHAGTAGGGHYTCTARNAAGWWCFDDQSVAPVPPHHLAAVEAYVLFYRKVNPQMTMLRQKAAEILESTSVEPNDIKFYISKQWINKFNTWAEPGAIDNSDFVCRHGGVRPDRARHLHSLAAVVPQPLWEFLYDQFGGGPACSHVHECGVCARDEQRLRARRDHELRAFYDLHAIFQEQECPRAIYAISMHWFRQWQAFVRNRTRQPPPPVDNGGIVAKQEVDGKTTYTLKQGSDHAQLSEELWRFFTDVYGGGPEVRLRSPTAPTAPIAPTAPTAPTPRTAPARPHSADRGDHRTKSTSDTDIRDTLQQELQKNQSLQNINGNHRPRHVAADSDDDVVYGFRCDGGREVNGNCHGICHDNCHDSDEDMDAGAPPTGRVANGAHDAHDANDNPVGRDHASDCELPNLDSISLKGKPAKGGKVRKVKRRTVK